MKPLSASDPDFVATYRLLGVLGTGGMGRVYLGESRTGRRVAIKVIRADLADDPVFRRRFAREVKAARSVSPLYTAAVVDADPTAEQPWLATTYIDGPSLATLVSTSGPLSTAAVLTLAAGLSDALASIHKVGLVHRDLKPGNVIIDDAGPHIIDFGIALTTDTTRITSGHFVGTPSYVAPEIIFRNESSPASDVFSLGATLVFAATGNHLVADGTMYSQIMQITTGQFDLGGVPMELRPLIVRCISAEPKYRPTAEEVARVLVASSVPGPSRGWYTKSEPAPQVTVPSPPARSSVRQAVRGLSRRRVLTIGGVLGAAAVAGAGIGAGARLAGGRAHGTWQAGGAPSSGVSAAASGPGAVLWHARSGTSPVPDTAGIGRSCLRMVAHPGRYVVAYNGPEVFATGADGRRLWSKTLSAGPFNLRRWGDAVLVTDGRMLWLLDAAKGTELFAVAAADDETKASRNDNADGLPVQVGAVAVSPDRAFVGLGTATIAIDRRGAVVWRVLRPPQRDGRRPPAGAPHVAQGPRLLTHDLSGASVQLGLRHSGNGEARWSVGYELTAQPQRPPGPGPGPGGGPGPGPGGGTGPGTSQGSGSGSGLDVRPPPHDDEAWRRSEGRFSSGHVVVRNSSELRILGLSDGREVWKKVSQPAVTAIEVVGDLLIIAADRVTAHQIPTGTELWHVDLRGARLALSADGKSIIAASERTVAALDLTGGTRWSAQLPQSVGDVMVDRLTAEQNVALLTFRGRDEQAGPPDVDVVAVALA
jgi:predicted Ser/Thr protein kinase